MLNPGFLWKQPGKPDEHGHMGTKSPFGSQSVVGMKDESLQEFDLDRPSDPSVRQEYEVMLRRAVAVALSTMNAYGKGRLPISCRFVEADVFNALVRRTEDFYAIEITTQCPCS